MSRELILSLLALPIGVVGAERPNIVMILADDMGFECLGANGSTYSTPNLDKLAEDGIRFTNCHAQPLSTPTRVELLSGLYNNRNYMSFGELDPSQRTFANVVKEQGYKTCIAGKWQLGADYDLPAHFGFDNYCLWQLTATKKMGGRYASVLYDVDGESITRDLDTYGPDVFSDYICDFIDKNSRAPFLVYYPMVLIHDPFNPTPDSEEWQDPKMRLKSCEMEMTANLVAYADKLVGKIVDRLKENGVLDNTIILFVGDNGTNTRVFTTMKDGSVIQGGKNTTKRNGTSVPMLAMWGSRIEAGQVNDNLVDVSDFYPTIRDLVDGDKGADRKLDGVSFYNQLIGKKYRAREWSFCHFPSQQEPNKYIRFAQTADYKLYSSGRFYNTRTDPQEANNLVSGLATTKEERIRKMLQKALDSMPFGSEIITDECIDITE
ncbi:MAG: sulfatase-like hydrolase/transferase [Rikenellaceae bacterium]